MCVQLRWEQKPISIRVTAIRRAIEDIAVGGSRAPEPEEAREVGEEEH
jgi:hypothetical protein